MTDIHDDIYLFYYSLSPGRGHFRFPISYELYGMWSINYACVNIKKV